MRQKYDKTAIIEKGVHLFRKNGYHNTGVDDILRTCEIPSGSFYNFFKSKEGFALQALEHYNQIYLEHLESFIQNQKISPTKRLKAIFQGNIKEHIDNDCSVGCLLNSLTSEVAANNPSIAEAATTHYRNNSQKIASLIKEGQKLKEIRTDFSATELAFHLIDSFSGATTRMQADRSDKPLKLFMKTAFTFIKFQ